MSENDKRAEEKISGAEIKLNSPIAKWFDNFFYHYKWHVIVAVFLIFVIVISSFQMCTKESYDAYVLYAGERVIAKTASDGDISEYQKLTSAIRQYMGDYDGNGSRNIVFENMFLPSTDQIKEIEADGEMRVDYDLVAKNGQQFREYILYGNFHVMLLSSDLFESWSANECPFTPIGSYVKDGTGEGFEYASEYGIYLGSTPLYEKAGFSMLPSDTVICMRMFSEVSASFATADNEENFHRSEELLRALLANEIYN